MFSSQFTKLDVKRVHVFAHEILLLSFAVFRDRELDLFQTTEKMHLGGCLQSRSSKRRFGDDQWILAGDETEAVSNMLLCDLAFELRKSREMKALLVATQKTNSIRISKENDDDDATGTLSRRRGVSEL